MDLTCHLERKKQFILRKVRKNEKSKIQKLYIGGNEFSIQKQHLEFNIVPLE